MFKNTKEIITKFVGSDDDKKSDYLKHENSNFIYSNALMRKNLYNFAEKKYLLDKVFKKELTDLYNNGDIYIHDKTLQVYCVSLSTKDISTQGIPSLSHNMLSSHGTENIYTFIRQMSNAVTLMSQQVSGAIMLSQMTTILASYFYYNNDIIKDPIDLKMFKQELGYLFWELNMPLRSGSESPFTNITMEFGKASPEIANEYILIGEKVLDIKYKDIPKEYFNIINRTIIDIMKKSSGTGIPFTFPLITVPITDDFDYTNKEFIYLAESLYDWGGVYFENFTTEAFNDEYYKKLNSRIKSKDPEVSRSLCCRLNIDLSLLSKAGSGIFGSSVGNTGAVQVLNLNIHRLLLRYKYEWNEDIDKLKTEMTRLLNIMEQGHLDKRNWIEAHKELYPTFFSYNKDLKNYFNVFAITGFHEGLINIGYTDGIKDKGAKDLTHILLTHMSNVVDSFIERDKIACGIEFAPAENASIKMARDDKKFAKQKYDIDIFVNGKDEDIFLTAGAMIPFSDPNMVEQIENHAEFQGYATSGTIFHIFLEDVISPEKISNFIKNLFKKPINYITLTPTLTSCLSCGSKFKGKDATEFTECPVCGASGDNIATFSRVIGYVKMISKGNIKIDDNGQYDGDFNFWSNAKRYDWAERKRTKIEDINTITDK